MRLIYLDYAATTPVDPRVMRAMRQYFSEKFGNPGSGHRIGQESFRAISHSRDIVAGVFGSKPEGVIFTSSATEANNLALRGVVRGITNYQLPITKGGEPVLQDTAHSRSSPHIRQAAMSAVLGRRDMLLATTRRSSEAARSVLGSLVPPSAAHPARSPVHVRLKHVPSIHIVTSVIEHDSVLEVCRALEEEGLAEVTYLGVSRDGIVNPADIAKALRPETVLVSVMYANNEIGTIQPLAEIANIIRNFRNLKHEARKQKQIQSLKFQTRNPVSDFGFRISDLEAVYPLLHTDAVQAAQFLDCDMERLGVDLLTVSSHKIYGPKGAAALLMRNPKHEARSSKQVQSSKLKTQNPVSDFEFRISDLRQLVSPIVVGGGQEYGLRSGTENVPAIVGFGKALELALSRRDKESKRLTKLRDSFIARLLALNKGVVLNGSAVHRLPNNVNVSFPSKNAQMLITALDRYGIAVSAGSACASHSLKPSRAIRALGLDQKFERGAIRFSLGSKTRRQDLDYVMQTIVELL